MARPRTLLKGMKGKSTRTKAKATGRAAGPPALDKLDQKTRKLKPEQRDAIEGLELGARYAGRSFKRAGSPGDTPTVRRRPPTTDESDRSGTGPRSNRGGRKMK